MTPIVFFKNFIHEYIIYIPPAPPIPKSSHVASQIYNLVSLPFHTYTHTHTQSIKSI